MTKNTRIVERIITLARWVITGFRGSKIFTSASRTYDSSNLFQYVGIDFQSWANINLPKILLPKYFKVGAIFRTFFSAGWWTVSFPVEINVPCFTTLTKRYFSVCQREHFLYVAHYQSSRKKSGKNKTWYPCKKLVQKLVLNFPPSFLWLHHPLLELNMSKFHNFHG